MLDSRQPDVVRAGWQAVAARGNWRDEPDRRGKFFDRLARHLGPQHRNLHAAALVAVERLAPDPRRTDVVKACCGLLDASPQLEVRVAAARTLREWMRLGIRLVPGSPPWRWVLRRSRYAVRTVQEFSQ